VHISVPYRPLEIVLAKAGGTHLINVAVEGVTHNALVREVQRDKVKRTILHVDFMRVDLARKVRTEVQITLVGVPKLSSDSQLTSNLASIEVECLPAEIPEHIAVDVSVLVNIGDQITVGDLKGYDKVVFLADPHEVIARIDPLTAVTAETEGEAAAAEPEVIEKGKKEEEE
jgi:large subunit ribosomal protein L25